MSVIRGQLNALRAADPLMSERLTRCLTHDGPPWSVQVLGLDRVKITLASEDVPLSPEFRASLLELRKELATQ